MRVPVREKGRQGLMALPGADLTALVADERPLAEMEDESDWFVLEFWGSSQPMDFLAEGMTGCARPHKIPFCIIFTAIPYSMRTSWCGYG